MTKTDGSIPVMIIGGGPVGLFLAICLHKKGIKCRVIEKREQPVSDSRSIGIHPVSLQLFDSIGIGETFIRAGIKVKKGIALNECKVLGEISFQNLTGDHKYILICPQFGTESILRKELELIDAEILITGAEFLQMKEGDEFHSVHFRRNGINHLAKCRYLIGCDGKKSLVRQHASIFFSGEKYPDVYIMGDFDDNTDLGTDAAVYLPKNGLIESFPLPQNKRRWVVKTDKFYSNPERALLEELVEGRIGHPLKDTECFMLSSFGVQHMMAEVFVKEQVILAGDAAHVVSPIGGQGMNLGWIGAYTLAEALHEIMYKHGDKAVLENWSSSHSRIAKAVARRAEFNMRLGRKRKLPLFRDLIVKGMLSPPFRRKSAEMFSMQGLVNRTAELD